MSEKKVQFHMEDSGSDSDSSSNELPDPSSAKQDDPDYYDPIYFDSDSDSDSDKDESNVVVGPSINAAEEQDDDEMEYDTRSGIPDGGSKTGAQNSSVKEITKGLKKSSLGPASSKGSKKTAGRPTISDADLLYDPDEDDRDQDWLIKKIAANRPKGSHPEDIWTDAILSCPMCLTQLCFDCQQHELYPHQFRAMFVEHCRVIENEVLRFPKEAKKSDRNTKSSASASRSKSSLSPSKGSPGTSGPGQGFKPSAEDDDDMAYHPVACEICNTKIALIDQDEVYHFFNVIPTPV